MNCNKLIIKYKGVYILNQEKEEIDFIKIPNYVGSRSDFYNIDIFISLLCSNCLNDSYEARKGFTYEEGLKVFSSFDPDCIKQLNVDVFLYDLDEQLFYSTKEFMSLYENHLENLPGDLKYFSYEELLRIEKESNRNQNYQKIEEDSPFLFRKPNQKVNSKLFKILQSLHRTRGEKEVLLLYSGGKDSTLSAIRLRKEGYHVHFFHFNNGFLLDEDKPYLTFLNTFDKENGYSFDYENHSIDIQNLFENYFANWKEQYGDVLEDATLDSEIRCLSCRMAMYTEILCYAKKHHFKYIAEGARIIQKFMIEQPAMIHQLKELAANYQIELLYPVLTLEDDFEEIQELIKYGFSSKSWESKCLLGRKPMEKTNEEEKIILEYYEDIIKPNMQKKLNRLK